jgi:hypothetical protein
MDRREPEKQRVYHTGRPEEGKPPVGWTDMVQTGRFCRLLGAALRRDARLAQSRAASHAAKLPGRIACQRLFRLPVSLVGPNGMHASCSDALLRQGGPGFSVGFELLPVPPEHCFGGFHRLVGLVVQDLPACSRSVDKVDYPRNNPRRRSRLLLPDCERNLGVAFGRSERPFPCIGFHYTLDGRYGFRNHGDELGLLKRQPFRKTGQLRSRHHSVSSMRRFVSTGPR